MGRRDPPLALLPGKPQQGKTRHAAHGTQVKLQLAYERAGQGQMCVPTAVTGTALPVGKGC